MWLWTVNAGRNGPDSSGRQNAEEEDGCAKSANKPTGFVLEYDAARKIAQSLGANLETLGSVIEVAGETAFCYASDPQPLLDALAHARGVRYLHRPANLEDLFIKLTGRELRD
jgi:hypothetical protein